MIPEPMDNMKGTVMKFYRLPMLLFVLLLGAEGLKRWPALIEGAYARGVYPDIARVQRLLFGPLPASVFEGLLWLVFLGLAAALVWLAGTALLGGLRAPGRQLFRGLLTALLGFAVLFNSLWGLNYHRLSVAEQLGASAEPRAPTELAALCARLIDDANRLSEAVPRDSDGVMVNGGSTRQVLARAGKGMTLLGQWLPLTGSRPAQPKAFRASAVLSYAGISGIYFPFTGEANVNGDVVPALLPATALHELAHGEGYAREDEANFIAWWGCRLHPDPDYQYSGALLALIYGMNALASADREAYLELKERYGPGVKADLAANRAFWARYEGPVEQAQDQLNDRYLKMNGQVDGVRSYGRMVDLLLAFGGDPQKNLMD